MSALAWGLISLGAALGAVARFVVDQAVQHHRRTPFPLGTLTINITGSLLLGVLTGAAAHHGLDPLAVAAAGTGLCGGYTTFSTWSYESVRLAEDGAVLRAALNITVSVAAGLLAAAAGLGIALTW